MYLSGRIAAEERDALTGFLLAGRFSADVAHITLAALTVFVFWGVDPAWASLAWFACFVGTTLARALNRKRVLSELTDPRAILWLLRRDVWIAALLWGGWAVLHADASPPDLALLLLIFSGLVAAATSTLVADGPSFYGLTALILGPLAGAVSLGELDRSRVSLLLLIALFLSVMTMLHRGAHRMLLEQIRAGLRLRIAEEETARRSDFLNALLTSAPTPIVVLDGEGRVMRVNPAFERVLAYDGAGVIGEPFVELVTDPRDRAPLVTFLDMVREGQRTTADLPVRRGDGRARWVRLSGTLGSGMVEGTLILVGEDVTDQVEARETQMMARIQAEEGARAKSSFLASMSHEIRTPLNGILGMIEILLDSPLTAEQRQTAQVVRESGRGLLRILNDVLDVSKIEAGQLDLEVVDFALHDLVAEVARIFTVPAGQRGNEIIVDVGRSVPRTVRGDPHRIRQILTNLVGNAVKFTDRGEVVLRLRSLGTVEERDRIHFSVKDTGVGIPLDKQEQIFREFEQADSSTTRIHGGTGLGLSISRKLVALMGGHLEVESAPGKGSDFHFLLELAPGQDDRASDTRTPPGVDLAGRRFLVVDDNATARRIVREALHQVGAEVTEVESALDGLEAMRCAVAERLSFDAVVLDHMMPELDGFDFVHRLRDGDAGADTPILMVTSAVPAGGAERARSAGINGYLAKPVSRAELFQALQAVLGLGSPPGQERRLVTRESIGRAANRARILLAEDNAVNQQVAVGLLSKRGHEVVAVRDGVEAVRAAAAGGFDLVLMDIQMPEMDGLEASRRIRGQPGNASLPIVALTAHAFAEERERCSAAGMNDFVAKPFKPGDLYEVVERWIGGTAKALRSKEVEKVKEDRDDAPAPVDLKGFRATMREAGVEEVVDATLEIYLSEAPVLFNGIEQAVASGEPEDVRRAAHSLKSASGNIRANRLAFLLQYMEDRGQAGDVDGARELFGALREEYRAVIEYLEEGRPG